MVNGDHIRSWKGSVQNTHKRMSNLDITDNKNLRINSEEKKEVRRQQPEDRM
jgi:hypothetical protein